jgi:hypothetical protein
VNVAALILPDFALIAIGWLLYRFAGWAPGFWEGAEKLVYYVLFPALLFGSIVRNPMSPGESVPMIGVAVGAVLTGVALGNLAAPVLKPPATQFASGVQCAFRFNTYVLLALTTRFAGDTGLALAALIVGFVVPTANFFSVLALARHAGGSVVRELLRNPLVLSTVAGLVAKGLGLRMPEPVDATLQRLGMSALAIGLLCVGAGLRLQRQEDADPAHRRSAAALAAWFTTTKLVAMPLVAWLGSRALGLAPLPQAIVVMFAAMPTAPAAYVLAMRMGGDGRFVAFLITVSMFAAMVTLPVWLALLPAASR